MKVRYLRVLLCCLNAIAGAITTAAAFPPYALPGTLLPGMLLLLLSILAAPTVRVAFYLGLGFGLSFFGLTLFWLVNLFGNAAWALIPIAALFPAFFAALLKFCQQSVPPILVPLAAPVLWVAVEYFRSELFTLRFGWMGLGYGLLDSRPATALMRWGGSYAGSFLVVALAAMLLFLLGRCVKAPRNTQRTTRRILPVKIGLVLVLTAWLLVSVIPVRRWSDPPERSVMVRLVQNDSLVLSDYLGLSRASIAPGSAPPNLIVWPEYSLFHDPREQADTQKQLMTLTRELNAWLVLGAVENYALNSEAPFHNIALVIGPEGSFAGVHVKNHPVHFMHDGVAGTTAEAISTDIGKLGIGICFDMDFPDVARRVVQDGAELLVVPNMDPAEWGTVQREQHRLVFRMRALECGRWLARADVAGGTSVCAPNGTETAGINTAGPGVLDAEVGLRLHRTPYIRGGWRFAQVNLGLAAAMLIAATIRRAQRKSFVGAEV